MQAVVSGTETLATSIPPLTPLLLVLEQPEPTGPAHLPRNALMLQAGVVAELRQEIVAMKERLAAAMGGGAGAAGSMSVSGIDKDMEAHARQAFLEVG